MNISLTRLKSFYSDLKTPLLLHALIRREFPGSIAVLTGFDKEAALLLALVAEIDPATPVLFPDNGGQDRATLDHAAALARHLQLSGVRHVASLEDGLETLGTLAVITGRRREHHPGMEAFELDDSGVFRIHPLANYTGGAIAAETARRALPAHPLAGSLAAFAEAAPSPPPATSPVPDWNL